MPTTCDDYELKLYSGDTGSVQRAHDIGHGMTAVFYVGKAVKMCNRTCHYPNPLVVGVGKRCRIIVVCCEELLFCRHFERI